MFYCCGIQNKILKNLVTKTFNYIVMTKTTIKAKVMRTMLLKAA